MFIEYSRFSSSSVAFLFYFSFFLLAFVDKSFYFTELGSLSFRVIFAGLKYQRDHRCHGDVTMFYFCNFFFAISVHDFKVFPLESRIFREEWI